jgi:invasion protein IalB
MVSGGLAPTTASWALACSGQGQLKVCVARNGVGRVFAEHLQRRLGIVLIEREVGDHHRQTADENALRIFCGKTG